MTLQHILYFTVFTIVISRLSHGLFRHYLLLTGSLFAVFWLQPASSIRNLDFWLPVVSIGMVVIIWILTQPKNPDRKHKLRLEILIISGVVTFIGATRYFGNLCCLTATRPPPIIQIIIVLTILGCFGLLLQHFSQIQKSLLWLAGILIIVIFILLKYDIYALHLSQFLRNWMGQDPSLATTSDLPWLGYSYLAFRLLHTIRDAQGKKLPDYSLGEFTTYALFFPALTAGPIDRSERFIRDYRSPSQETNRNTWIGLQRVLVGLLKKFVLADSLALFALNSQNANQVGAPIWMWIVLYTYSLRLYLDFSGYTDIALGLGAIVGINLPENFNAPYFRTNLTAFWNSWHITLANWFRAYLFNPLTRFLRGGNFKLPVWPIVLVGQITTMTLIGLWHGITWNFFIWGLWHALGLFVHNRWTEWRRRRIINIEIHPWKQKYISFFSWLITFHYVTLGWVWFALPGTDISGRVFSTLFGLGS
ncbi:MAG: MBOAT family protein [Anaerolineales bacterium]|nr:MAG: MBOAT family protein [Anaerolineales bacterium]